MENKIIEILFSDLDPAMQNRIASIIAEEACKSIRTPPINDPCADMGEFSLTVMDAIYNVDPVICETDLEELGKEAGVL